MAALKRALFALALCLAAFTAPEPAAAQADVRLVEQDIKAGLLYNFLRYTEWPAPAEGNVVVCVYGRDPFAGRLAPMAGRTVNQRAIEVRAIGTFAQAESCTLLFVNAEERARWPALRDHLRNQDVLTVSDYEGFTSAGGMIEFTRAERRIGVRINTAAVDAAHLVVQERLLRLAEGPR